jgi:hypothetical protein
VLHCCRHAKVFVALQCSVRYSTAAVLHCFAALEPTRCSRPPSSPSVVMPSDIVALPAADAEVLKQRLDALVVAIKAAEEKAATVRRRVLAVRQLLDEE